MTDEKRREVRKFIDLTDTDLDHKTLKEVRESVDVLIEHFGESATLVQDSGHENISNYIELWSLETDEEYNKRMLHQKQDEERTRNRELKQLERLKKKYEGSK